ncbi:MAG: hypothetical protein KGI82_08920 [Betaproteobacteria bacterium]|nr:hypothetical protein [Betaproteobacteria bacterium]
MPDFPDDVVERVARALCRLALQPTQTEFTFPSLEARVFSEWKKFIPAAIAAIAAAWEWKDPRKELPTKPGKKDYEYVDTLIIKKNGDVLFRPWNCEHLVFDDECYDDFYCDADDVSLWCEVIKPLSPPPEAHDD